MLIEASSLRLAIDLLESLRKFKLIASDIRLSFIDKKGSTLFRTFSDLDSIKLYYLDKYNRLINSKRDPFTKDRKNARLTPLVKDGIIISQSSENINDSRVQGFCELDKFIAVESIFIKSDSFNSDLSFKCLDVSGNFKIIKNVKNDSRKNSTKEDDINRYYSSIQSFINDYQKILDRLYKSYNSNLYTDLCYVEIGYTKESLQLYDIYFALVKGKIDSGLRLSVLEPRFLKKIG